MQVTYWASSLDSKIDSSTLVPEKLQEDSNSDHSNVGLPAPSTFWFWKKRKKHISLTIDPFGHISFSSSPYSQSTDVTKNQKPEHGYKFYRMEIKPCNPTRSWSSRKTNTTSLVAQATYDIMTSKSLSIEPPSSSSSSSSYFVLLLRFRDFPVHYTCSRKDTTQESWEE